MKRTVSLITLSRAAVIVMLVTAVVLVGSLVTPASAAQDQATIGSPLPGEVTSVPGSHHIVVGGDWSMDVGADPGTAVRPRFTDVTDNLELHITRVFESCSTGNGGAAATVSVTVGGTEVGVVHYLHLTNLKPAGTSIDNGERIGDVAGGLPNDPDCWTGPHVHVEPYNNTSWSCFVPRARREPVASGDALGVIGGEHADGVNQSCPQGATDPGNGDDPEPEPDPDPTGEDGELIRGPSGKVHVMAGGAPLHFRDRQAFEESGHSWADVVDVSSDYVDGLRDYPNDRTRLKNHNNDAQFVVAGRSPLKVHGPSAVEPIRESSGRPLVIADARAIDDLPDSPTDRSVLKNHDDDTQYVVAGRARLRIHSREVLEAIRQRSGRHTVVADSRGIADLPTQPSAGTSVEGYPSGEHWVVEPDGSLSPQDSVESPVLVDDEALEGFPSGGSDDGEPDQPDDGDEGDAGDGDEDGSGVEGSDEADEDDEEAPSGVTRVSGVTRFGTAATLSEQAYPNGSETAYVATGLDFADALAGGVAAARDDAPVLLVGRSGIPASTADELERLDPDRIVMLGGVAAAGSSVEDELGSYADQVDRVAGPDRFATAAAISASSFEDADSVDTAYLATGLHFADALSAVSAAAHTSGPLLLATASDVPEATTAELERLDPARIVVVGGDGVLGADVEAEAERFADRVDRLAGSSRFATAAEIGRDAYNADTSEVFVATGSDFADALAGGAVAGARSAPVLLAAPDALTSSSRGAMGDFEPPAATLLGGSQALSAEVEQEVRGLLVDTES